LCPAGLGNSSVIYSAGVGKNVSFDLSVIRRFGAPVFAFDPTPEAVAYIRSRSLPPEFRLLEVGLAGWDGTASFSPNRRRKEPSHILLPRPETQARSVEAPVKTLPTLAGELGHARIDLLKLDIEGAEYAVIEQIVAGSLEVKQLLVEFHHRFKGIGRARTNAAIRSLQGRGYRIFHISDTGREYAFLLAE
jgi:FkbM family methyltransferase